MKKRKGLSPLIAAVILIAATMTIAGILSFWVSSFVQTELTESAEITGGAECLAAHFELHSGSLEGNTLHLILDNKKSVDLFLTNVYLIYPNNDVVPKNISQSLNGNEIKRIMVQGIDPNFLTGEIKTQCPDVSVFFTRDQVA